MDTNEAVQIIEGMIASIRENPAQFQIELKVTGQRITSYGGTGLHVSAVGGGAGSTTIGNQVSLDGAQFEIVSKQANQAMTQQIEGLIGTLSEIAGNLKEPIPDKGRLRTLLDSLKAASWVPNVISSTVSTILALLNLTAE